jgi:hypothetical protein
MRNKIGQAVSKLLYLTAHPLCFGGNQTEQMAKEGFGIKGNIFWVIHFIFAVFFNISNMVRFTFETSGLPLSSYATR